MRRTSLIYVIAASALLLLASCGKQYAAERRVKEFVEENAVEKLDIRSFSDLDSTRVIGDSLLQAMRQRALTDTLFRQGTKLTAERQGPTLYYIRMRYRKDTVELSRTFYFNQDMEGVVAFK